MTASRGRLPFIISLIGVDRHRGLVAVPLPSLRKIQNKLLRFWSELQLRHSQSQPVLLDCWNPCRGARHSGYGCHSVAHRRGGGEILIHPVCSRSVPGRSRVCALFNLYRSLCAAGLLHPVSQFVGFNRRRLRRSSPHGFAARAPGVKLSNRHSTLIDNAGNRARTAYGPTRSRIPILPSPEICASTIFQAAFFATLANSASGCLRVTTKPANEVDTRCCISRTDKICSIA